MGFPEDSTGAFLHFFGTYELSHLLHCMANACDRTCFYTLQISPLKLLGLAV